MGLIEVEYRQAITEAVLKNKTHERLSGLLALTLFIMISKYASPLPDHFGRSEMLYILFHLWFEVLYH